MQREREREKERDCSHPILKASLFESTIVFVL